MNWLIRLISTWGAGSYCRYCGGGPYSEAELYQHIASSHPGYPN